MAFEEGFADGEHLVALALKAPWTFEQPASALAPDQIADVVAHDCRRCGERDDQLDVQLAPAREHRGRDQRGLAGDRDAARLAHHEHEQQRVARDAHEVVDVQQRGKHAMRARAPTWCFPRRAA